jgi:hypothetical protein
MTPTRETPGGDASDAFKKVPLSFRSASFMLTPNRRPILPEPTFLNAGAIPSGLGPGISLYQPVVNRCTTQ